MKVEPYDEQDSQESSSSDCRDEITSYNEQLHYSVRQQSIMGIESALSNKSVKINYQNKNGDTALHLAVRKRNADIVDFLIKHGADVNILNENRKTPLRMVEERLKKEPNDPSLQSIEAFLRRAQIGSSLKRPHDEIKSEAGECQAKRSKIYTETYPSHGLRTNFHGPIYQAKLLALFVKRALKENYEFSIASEMDDAGALDDIVFTYKEMNKWTWRFVQAKHKQNTENTKISISELTSKDNGDFSLQKYFISYCKIKYNESFGMDDIHEDFTIITNTEFDFINTSLNKGNKENIARIKLWNKYFEEETNLHDDPILYVKTHMFKPRKFKFTKMAKSDLYELFKSNLLESVLNSKEIAELNVIKNKLKLTNSIKRENEEDLIIKDDLVDEIIDQCENKKGKTRVIRFLNEFLNLMKDFLNENGCQQSVCNLKKSLEMLKKPYQEKSNIDQQMQDICSEIKEAMQQSIENRKDFEEKLEKYSDLSSKEYFDLEQEKNLLFDDERELRKIREVISKSNNLEWIKEKITNDILKRNNRISQNVIKSIRNQSDIIHTKRILDEQFVSILLEISMIKIALNDNTFETCLDEFLEKFCIITNYSNEWQLSIMLHDEIGEEFSLLNVDLMRDSFEREMINFLKKEGGRFYHGDEGKHFFEKMEQTINTFMSIGLCKSYTEQLDTYGICFDDRFKQINKLDDFIANERQKVLHISAKYTRLSAIKVFRNLTDSGRFAEHDSYIFIRLGTILHRKKTRKFILNAFKSGTQLDDEPVQNNNIYNLCVIECREDCWKNIEYEESQVNFQKLVQDLLNILSENLKKKIIIIAPNDDLLSEKFRNCYAENMNQSQTASADSGINLNEHAQLFEMIEDQIEFKHLDENSQDKVLEKNVKFQEKESIRFDQLIDKNLACQIIDTENLLRLIENEKIQIGNEKAFHSIGYVEDFYITREFNSEQNPMGNTNNISEEDLVKNSQKVNLLSNDAGMGKSTVLTSIAIKIREKMANAWIVRIDLNDYANIKQSSLNQIKFNEQEISQCNHFVSKMVVRGKPDNTNIRLQRALIEASLEKIQQNLKKPPIVILLDGFDEISPLYKEKTTTLINALKASNVDQLWITTRPHEKVHLQKELHLNAYYLQPLKEDEQITFLDNFLKWYIRCGRLSVDIVEAPDRSYLQMRKQLVEMKKATTNDTLRENISNILENYPILTGHADNLKNDIKSVLSFTEYIKDNLLSFWSKGVFAKNGNFYGTPLNLKMLSVVISAEKKLISKLEPFDLYQKYVNIQFTIYYKNKSKSRSGNQAAKETREDHENYLNKIHNSLAVQTLFRKDYEENLLPNLSELEELKEEIKQGKGRGEKVARVGLLTLRSEDLEFIHRNFAEFFLSKYLMKNIANMRVQKILIENILVESAYGVTRQFFNDQLDGSDGTIELTNDSKNFIQQNLQSNSENNIRTVLTNENHSKIIDFFKIN